LVLSRDKKTREREEKLKMLHEACRRGREDEVARMLAEKTDRVDINARDPGSGWTALHFAALRGDPQVIRRLVDAGCNVSAQDSPYEQTPLHVASKYSHAEACRQLLLANADPSMTNTARKTALQARAPPCSPRDASGGRRA
jgi:ankyrin repeat protein